MNTASPPKRQAWLRARFSFQGRASCREYWLQGLASVLLFLVTMLIVIILIQLAYAMLAAYGGAARRVLDWMVFLAAMLLLLVNFAVCAWALLAAATRRSHDLDSPLFGGFSGLLSLRGLTARGTTGPNRYGSDPLQVALPE